MLISGAKARRESVGSSTSGRYELVGTKESVVLDPACEYSSALEQTVTINDKSRQKKFPRTDQFGGEIEAFSDWVLDRCDPEPSAAEGVADLRVIEAIHLSLRTGRIVRLDTFKETERPDRTQVKRKPPVKEPDPVAVESPHD